MTAVNFVLQMAKADGSRVTVAGGASFVKVNGKDWEVGQSICARGTNVTKKKEFDEKFWSTLVGRCSRRKVLRYWKEAYILMRNHGPIMLN